MPSMTREERRYWRTQYIKLAAIIVAAVAAAVVIRSWAV